MAKAHSMVRSINHVVAGCLIAKGVSIRVTVTPVASTWLLDLKARGSVP